MTNDNLPDQDVTFILRDIASSVMQAAGAGTVEQVLERIAHVSADLVKAKYAALGVPDGGGGLRFFKVAGMTEAQIARMDHLPHGRGLLGAIMAERQALRLEHMRDDSRAAGFCAHHPSMTSLLGVPVQVGKRLFGILYLCDRRDGQPFTEQDQWLVETLAGYAALAIAGAEISEQQGQLAMLEERERIGMELHDGVIQSLYAIGMNLDILRLGGAVQPDDLRETIGNLNNVIDDIRRYILNLKAPTDRTVHGYLHDVIERLYVPQTINVDLDAPHLPPPFSPGIFEAICQIANEALSNAVRHANAQNITISAGLEGLYFNVVVKDDGLGFDLLDPERHDGLGLRNIQQRARLHGGTVHIDSRPGNGTQVTISIPTRPV